jgi:hypothetical protein
MADTDNSDFQQVQQLIKGEVEKYAAEAFSKHQSSSIPQQTEQQQAQQQLRELINPFVEPKVNEAMFAANDAKDYVDFYNNNDVESSYRKQVEDTFSELKKGGRPLPRKDIMKYLYGDEFVKDPEKFTEKQLSRKKEQLDRAAIASDFGAGAMDRAKNDSTWTNFKSLSTDDMEKALEGMTF